MRKQLKKILSKKELDLVKNLKTPHKVQDFLDDLPFNFEEKGDTYRSPCKALEHKEVQCFEGALLACLCLAYHSIEHYLIDLKVKKSAREDSDHTLCVFKMNGYWGAISKTNHSVLRWRDPIYKDVRELAFSYFHEYFLNDGGKTLESFAKPFNVWEKFGVDWVISEDDLDEIADVLDKGPRIKFVPKVNKRLIRKAGDTEIEGAMVEEWEPD